MKHNVARNWTSHPLHIVFGFFYSRSPALPLSEALFLNLRPRTKIYITHIHEPVYFLPFNQRLVGVLLAHRYHRMLACGHRFLSNRPVTCHIPWIHARIIGTLKATLFAIAFVELSRTVCAWRDATKFKQLIRSTVSVHIVMKQENKGTRNSLEICGQCF